MDKDSKYVIIKVWEDKTKELENEIVDFWLAHGALTREQAEERVKQVFCVIRDSSDKIVGVSTVYIKYNERLENSFYYYRSFVAPEHRQESLARNLLKFTRDDLNKAFVEGVITRCIGMMVEVENEYLKKNHNEGIWPDVDFVYIGKNNRGDHVRLFYFEGARIS
ncbi:MAG: hypothetical protein JW976_14620 [Syntrophaceae bacterium]|nr:hypothetical protein [Syntrophaceae bacterium]